jgi:hypothetical protein
MLLDLHANPGDLSPEEFANAVRDAGLDAVVVTRTNRADGLEPYLDALEAVEVDAFMGVELALEKGMVVFIPSDESDAFVDANWTNKGRPWTQDALKERLSNLDGAAVASHPYYRDEHPALGDRIYQLSPLSGVITRLGRGRVVWDRLAEQAAVKRGLSTLGSSGGNIEHLGAAATVFSEDIETQLDLVTAIKTGVCMTIEMDDPAAPRDREPPRPAAPRGDDDHRGSRDGRRGGRPDDRGGRDGRGRERNNRSRH